MKELKVTTPKQMAPDLSQYEVAVLEFEKLLKAETKGLTYYHLVISGELNREVCRKIRELYTNAGWEDVECKTSSDNGERPGLTGLVLRTKF